LDDCEAWISYPEHRKWFNKLDLASRLGHYCGPAGVPPDLTEEYVVRPIYNLSGMGIGSRIQHIHRGDTSCVEPGYFWCEKFTGEHVSVNYVNNGAYWFQTSAWIGYKKPSVTDRFEAWIRTDKQKKLPSIFLELLSVPAINVEFIGSHIIEVHLRPSPDPDKKILIPVWEDDPESKITMFLQEGFSYESNEEAADGFLHIRRKGFLTNDSYDNKKLFTTYMSWAQHC
jgi:hypothetical protein